MGILAKERQSNQRRLFIYLFLVSSLFPGLAFSEGASLSLFPSKLILTKNDRTGIISLLNRGDRTGVYEIFWVDNVMTATGGLERVDKEGQASEFSLKPFARFSPKRVQLQPGERQVLKIAIRGKNAEEKEYFSHISVRSLTENLESAEQKAIADAAEENKANVFQVVTHKVADSTFKCDTL